MATFYELKQEIINHEIPEDVYKLFFNVFADTEEPETAKNAVLTAIEVFSRPDVYSPACFSFEAIAKYYGWKVDKLIDFAEFAEKLDEDEGDLIRLLARNF